jgi:hypothetical protein
LKKRSILLLGVAVSLISVSPVHANIVINPFFETSITSDPSAAAIEATINSAVAFYESTISTNISVGIAFGSITSGLGESISYIATNVPYNTFITALHAASSGDATDTTALAANPISSTNPVNGGSIIAMKAANYAAIGFALPPLADPCPGGTGGGSGFDGCILVNTSITNPPSSPYSLLGTVEHEIDEVLGLGSGLRSGTVGTPAPEDLFRYTAGGSRSYGLNSQATVSCAGASAAYFSLNGSTDLAQFNNCNNGGDYGDWLSPSSPPQVQDAFASPGATPSLNRNSPEVVALDAIGYNLVPVPEPSSFVLFGCVAALAVVMAKRRAKAAR